MFTLQIPWWEIAIRALVIGLFLAFRLSGKKQLGDLSPFDFVLIIVLSQSVSNSLVVNDHSTFSGLISAFPLVGFTSIVDLTAFRVAHLEKPIDGQSANEKITAIRKG